MHLQTAASAIIGSEVVELPNARFDLLGPPWTAAQPVVVDLGRLKKYASDPNKTYAATRNYQEIEKTFRFRMAKRTDVSLIQLGYRLTIGKKSIPLIDFSRSPVLGQGATAFPSGTIEFDYEDEERVYDVYQQRPLSAAEEDEFEANGTVTGTPRLFVNERIGQVSFSGSVAFEHDPNDQGFTGEAVVTIRTVDPEHFPDAAILHVKSVCRDASRHPGPR